MLKRFRDILGRDAKKIRPNHIAFTTEGKTVWAREHNVPIGEVYKKSFLLIKSAILTQIRENIAISTFYLLSSEMKDLEQFSELIDAFVDFFNELSESELIMKNRVKVSVFGKWYDLPGRVVDPIRAVIDATINNEDFFVNFCINYHGQEEIVDACKLIARQVKADKLDVDSVTRDMIRDNLYSSSFLPPDIIIKNGIRKGKSDLLLWDSMHAYIYYTGKLWPLFEKQDILDAIDAYSRKFS
jgi:undecaprenyl diphosphate synthase